MFVGHPLFLARFGSCDPGLVALRQGVEGLELVALLQPALLTLRGLMAGLFDDLALGGDGVIKAANEGAVVAPGVGAQTVARGLHEAFVVFVPIVFEHLQLLLHIALGRDELTQAAGSVVDEMVTV